MDGVLGLKPLGWSMVKYSIKCYFSNFININTNNQIETNTLKGPPYVAEFVQSKVSNTFLYSLITFLVTTHHVSPHVYAIPAILGEFINNNSSHSFGGLRY